MLYKEQHDSKNKGGGGGGGNQTSQTMHNYYIHGGIETRTSHSQTQTDTQTDTDTQTHTDTQTDTQTNITGESLHRLFSER